ncbi:LppA-related lipoprotein [Mycoplasmopsis edwardii]|uniref:Uncharacterized protein n=1 Tax=Mycoplasmopsis edwardii TaxID=53558 RepID=A0ACD4PJF7_9BACT|nr:hypothetical protein [Mycoplasmopsis edwardii]WBP83824.1 hypothetical protein Me_995_000448 [Mycoplasmopsis edwardii]
MKIKLRKINTFLLLSSITSITTLTACSRPQAVQENANDEKNNGSNDANKQVVQNPENNKNQKEPKVPIQEQPTNPDPGSSNSEPSKNQDSNQENDFAELENFPTSFSLRNDSKYKTYDAKKAYDEFKQIGFNKMLEELNISQELKEKYNISITNFYHMKIHIQDGELFEVEVYFVDKQTQKTKSKMTKLVGFSTNNQLPHNEKDDLLTKKENLGEMVKLYPSLVGAMLMYNSNITEFNQLESREANAVTFEKLANTTTDYFSEWINLNPSINGVFFDLNPELERKYSYKIVRVNPNDLQGTLGIEVLIKDADEASGRNESYTKKFEFFGFKKISQENIQNTIGLTITPATLADEIKKRPNFKNKIKQAINEHNSNETISIKNKFSELELNSFKNTLFRITMFNIFGDGFYRITASDLTVKDLMATTHKLQVYPFVSHLSEQMINDIDIFIEFDATRNEKIVKFVNTFGFSVLAGNAYVDFTESNGFDQTLNVVSKPYIFTNSLRDE